MASAGAEAILKLNLTKINTNLLRKSRQTFLIILFHLIPMVIRPNISFYRNVNLLLIMQELHQYITTLILEEYKLDIRSHRSCLEITPMLINFSRSSHSHIEVFYLQ